MLVPRMVEEKIVGIPSGVNNNFEVLSNDFKLGLIVLLICVFKCEGT